MAEVHGSAAPAAAIPDFLTGTEAQLSRPLGRPDAWWSRPAALDAGPRLGHFLFWCAAFALASLVLDLALRPLMDRLTAAVPALADALGQPHAVLLRTALLQGVLLLALWTLLLRPFGWTHRPGWSLASLRWRWVAAGLVMMVVAVVVCAAWLVAMDRPENRLMGALMARGSAVLLVLSMVVLAPLVEELVCRDLLFGALARTRLRALGAWLVSSVCFAMVHGQYDRFELLPVFLIGLILGWIRWRTGSVLTTVVIHASWNGLLVGLSLALRAGGML